MTFKISDGMLLGSQVLLDPDRVMTATDYDIKADYTTETPVLNLDFTNNNKLDPRISFTRNSIGTYTDAATHVSTQNLAPTTESLNASLSQTVSSVAATTAVAAPVGTAITNRFIFTELTNADREHYAYNNFGSDALLSNSTRVITFSVYLKAGTHQYVQVTVGNNPSVSYAGIVVNLANGTFVKRVMKTSATLNSFTYAITDAGDGWYRCSITCVGGRYCFVGTVGNIATHVEDTGYYGYPRYTGSASNTFYLCGWQVEYGTQPTVYTPATGASITKSMRTIKTATANVPRFEYDPLTGESKGLLLEDTRTNLLTYSSDFSNAAWGKQGATIPTSNVVVAPDGSYAYAMVETAAAAAQHRILKSLTLTATTYTLSLYAKKGYGSRYISLNVDSFAAYDFRKIFDLSTGTLVASPSGQGTETHTITPVGDGWYRITTTFLGKAASGSLYIELNSYPTGTNGVTYNGDGVSSVYIWGAQLEVGTFASSYIPTVASTVTRQDDIAQMTGTNFSSWYSNSATGGTMFCEVNDMDSNGTNTIRVVQLQGTNEGIDRIQFGAATNTTVTSFNVLSASAASTGATFTLGSQFNSNLKLAGAWATDDFAYTYNGNTPSPAIDYVPVPTNMVSLVIGNKVSPGNVYGRSINGHIKSFRYYNTRLSNAQLQVLTA